jgi:hypothetical protein
MLSFLIKQTDRIVEIKWVHFLNDILCEFQTFKLDFFNNQSQALFIVILIHFKQIFVCILFYLFPTQTNTFKLLLCDLNGHILVILLGFYFIEVKVFAKQCKSYFFIKGISIHALQIFLEFLIQLFYLVPWRVQKQLI